MIMKTSDIVIRDPFVLAEEGKYYLYGTRSLTCWGEADGFDAYVSDDLENWEGPIEIFHKTDDFPYDKNYWAPEVHKYKGAYYMFATFNTVAKDMKGTMILKSESPLGPFKLHSEGKITPEEWNCLDGTFYLSPDGVPYMIFSHEGVDIFDGEICARKLSEDLKRPAGEPFTLFKASEATGWVRSITHRRYPGKEIYVTDGPFAFRNPDGSLALMWSSFGDHGYVEAVAYSDNNDVTGKWTQGEKPLYTENGGHGMLFKKKDGKLCLTLHYPNENYHEHPVFIEMPDRI
jgi:GH43 family beta-xylosidase